jgi:phosphoribosylglycinamide formyltransferase 1
MAQRPEDTQRARIAILISGRGSNMIALANAVLSGLIERAEITLVLSDQSTAAGLTKARELGLQTVVIERLGRPRVEHDREIIAAMRERQIDLICLAGFMRVLSPAFIAAYPGRILNIHPSLLPLYPGLEAQQQALEAGARTSGCTVHYVDETLDGGPVVAQRSVTVFDDDTVESLSARILKEEHTLYSEAVTTVLNQILNDR